MTSIPSRKFKLSMIIGAIIIVIFGPFIPIWIIDQFIQEQVPYNIYTWFFGILVLIVIMVALDWVKETWDNA